MRISIAALACGGALAMAACGQSGQQTAAQGADSCARTASHTVGWSSEAAPDVVTARAEGPSCGQAVVTLVVRGSEGDPLWTFASPYYDMTAGGRGPEPLPQVSAEEMDRFLDGWSNVTINRSGELPEWREGAASLAESVEGASYHTEFERETYESLRARDLPQLCFAAGAEASHCLVMDPLSHSATVIVAYGP